MDKKEQKEAGKKTPALPHPPPLTVTTLANLRKNLVRALNAFEKNREWADISHWLQKVAGILEDYPSPEIPEKLVFAKRLAQCLNPSLPPGIHQNTLHVYGILFLNLRAKGKNWAADMGIFSLGLFPLIQDVSFQVREA